MPEFFLQSRRASPFRSTFIMISLPESASITGAPQKERLFCRVVDFGRKREGAAIDFFRTQEADIL
jgi:hypothetical protein